MKIKVIIPALNEEHSVDKVIKDFKRELPKSEIIVIDGFSKDNTREIAKRAGAKVIMQSVPGGKGIAVREAFRNIDADIYVMVDGDDTYPADRVKDLIRPIIENRADIVLGTRTKKERDSMSFAHNFGNYVITKTLNFFFKTKLTDVLTGYRAIRRDVVKNLILLEDGFAIETEMTIKGIMEHYRTIEIPVKYKKRKGSESKLKTFKHGRIIMIALILLFRDYKPILFFGALSLIPFMLSFILGGIVLYSFITSGFMNRPGMATLSAMLFLSAIQIFSMGVLLDSVKQRLREEKERSKWK